MKHLYEIKDKMTNAHYWEVFSADIIESIKDRVYVDEIYIESFDDWMFTDYNTDMMANGEDFCIHFYDEEVSEYHLTIDHARWVKT